MVLLLIIYSIFGLILALSLFIYLKLIYPQQRLYNIFRAQGIPGESFIPIVGQLLDMLRASKENKGVEYFHELSQKHGYRFLFGFGPLTRLVLLEPELIADVLGRSKAENYRKPTDLVNIVKPILGVHNLLVSEGEEHERARKMLNPAFHFVNIQSMVPIMSEETSKAIDSLLLVASSSNEINIGVQLNALTLSIIASSAFGQSFETIPHAKEILCYLFNEVKEVIAYRTLRMISQVKFLAELPFWGKDIVDNGARKLNEFVNQAIADRRNGKSSSLCSGQDILDLLLSAIDDKGESFSDQQIKDEALTFILAGHETTGNLMTWVLYILMTHYNILQACREEVDRILPNQTMPTFEHKADLHIIEAVLHETLRLYPPAPFFVRECIKEHIIGSKNRNDEIRVPVGAMIVIHSYVLHRREQYWPRPLEFDHKRWIRDPITGLKPKLAHPYAYLPFAAGPRNCIGQNFALLEAKVMLAMFVQRCDFELVPGQKFAPEMKGVTMKPKYDLFARVKKRHL
jgi:cytochrome P450